MNSLGVEAAKSVGAEAAKLFCARFIASKKLRFKNGAASLEEGMKADKDLTSADPRPGESPATAARESPFVALKRESNSWTGS